MPTASSSLILTGTVATLSMLLLAAVLTDIKTRRIPNRLVITGIAAAALLHAAALALSQPPLAGTTLLAPLWGLLAGGVLLLPLYLLRACGAGDVKLLAMAGAFLGPQLAAVAVLYALAAGGLLSLVFMLKPGVASRALANLGWLLSDWMLRLRHGGGAQLAPLAVTAARLPYAVAIAIGAVAALLWPLGRT